MLSEKIKIENQWGSTFQALPSCVPQDVFELAITLHRGFSSTRAQLLNDRNRCRANQSKGTKIEEAIQPLKETQPIRQADWVIHSLENPYFEVDCDFEDTLPPLWDKWVQEMRRVDHHTQSARIRGLHLEEWNCQSEGRPIPASFLDLAFLSKVGKGVQIMLPKIENYLEARFWSDVFRKVESFWGYSYGTLLVMVEIETIHSVIQADEILFELRDRLVGVRFDSKDYASHWIKTVSPLMHGPIGNLASKEERKNWLDSVAYYLGILCEKRGVLFSSDIDWRVTDLSEPRTFALMPISDPPSSNKIQELIFYTFTFLHQWLQGEGKVQISPKQVWDLSDFELARSLLWQWLKSGAINKEFYLNYKEEIMGSSGQEAQYSSAILDTLLLNGVIADYSIPIAAKFLKSA